MIISRTPFRISFFGGGTDYPAWYLQHGGAVLATTINKYCYLTCRYLPPFFEHRFRIVWSKIENCHTVDEITHPAVKAILRYMQIERGVEIHHDGDLPARSGIGSSSSFAVGLLNALYALQGRIVPKQQLTAESIRIEQEHLREIVGTQDQVMTSYGGFNHLVFQKNGEISVIPMTLSRSRIDELESHLMLFYTGIKRTSSEVANSYAGDLPAKFAQMQKIRGFVDEALEILCGPHDIRHFGALMQKAWFAKRELGGLVTNPAIDAIYQRAIDAGAIGGKLLGAGGGGFVVLFVPPEKQANVHEQLGDLVHVPFRFDYTGSQVIFYDPEENFEAIERAANGRQAPTFRELNP
jgi:D-glycero-alpha-D-manno-heptose-7-phosphate kinase